MFAIVVVGMPKSGTSALYAAIKQTGEWLSIYETSNPRQFDYLATSRAERKLTKVLTPKAIEIGLDLEFFDRQVFTVRDPRDIVVSWLMYRPFLHGNYRNEPFIDDLAAALRAKEATPRSVSLAQIREVFDKHDVAFTRHRDFREQFQGETQLLASTPQAFAIRYEDFVDGDLQGVSEYLGIELTSRTRLGSHISFNERSKSYGGWRHWFTPEDIEAYGELFEPYLERHGYDTSWDLADDPHIDPATASEHLLGNVERLRMNPESDGELGEPELYTAEYVTVLQSAVNDGREPAIVELGLAHLTGYGVERDERRALSLLRDAAMRGSPKAMVHLGMAYRYGVGLPTSEATAKTYFKRASSIRGNRPTKTMMGRVSELWEPLGRRG